MGRLADEAEKTSLTQHLKSCEYCSEKYWQLTESLAYRSTRIVYNRNIRWLANLGWSKPYEKYLQQDATVAYPTVLRILDRRFSLLQHAKSIAHLSGDTAECGVYLGVGSALICKSLEATYASQNSFHFGFDSFQGLPAPKAEDRHEFNVYKKGQFSVKVEAIEEFLTEFPFCRLVPGWLPKTLDEVTERRFRFVHIDVDFHEPTRDCLEFFYPRMVPGGVLFIDDYGFTTCAGCRTATNQFLQDKPEKLVELATGQAFVIKR